MAQTKKSEITGWQYGQTILETHCLAPYSRAALPAHFHEEYQINLSCDETGYYRYRGATHTILPRTSFSVLHSGEPHSGQDLRIGASASHFRVLYVAPETMRGVAEQTIKSNDELPFVADPVVNDAELFQKFWRFHQISALESDRLEKDSLLLDALADLLRRYTKNRQFDDKSSREHRAVKRAKDYLHQNLAQNVSLAELAQIANLSQFQLCRVFKRQIGFPPHAYQILLRLSRSRQMLTKGFDLCCIAHELGFADQSRFGVYFKRFVGVSPDKYRRQN